MFKLNSMRVSTRMQLLVGFALVGLLAVCVSALVYLKSAMLEDRRDKLKSQVESAVGILQHYGKFAQEGKLSEAEAKEQARQALRGVRYSGNEYFFIYHANGVNFLLPIKPEMEGKNMLELKDPNGVAFVQEMIRTAKEGGGFVSYMWNRSKDSPVEPKLSYATQYAPWDMMIGTGVFISDIEKAYWNTAMIFGGISVVVLLGLSILSWRVSRSIFAQLGGEPAFASEIMRRIAGGDLTVKFDKAEPGSLLDALGSMVGSLREMVCSIRDDANTLVTNAEHISSASSEVVTTAALQSDATSAMAAAIEQLTVSSGQIAERAQESARETTSAVELSGKGCEQVAQASESIQRISSTVSDASDRIRALEVRAGQVSSIANVIKDIAGQTNLLALNAAIEAARAGEQGRGFAVVADEVRKLAERTSSATLEIEEMIAGIQGETIGAVEAMNAALPGVQDGVELANAATGSLQAIENGARRTLDQIRDVAEATQEQSSASTSIAQRVEQITNMVEETSVAIQGTAEIARKLEHIAGNLNNLVGRFKV